MFLEWNLLFGTPVGDPIPGGQALDIDGDVWAERLQYVEQELLIGRDLCFQHNLTSMVNDAKSLQAGVQIDATVELVGLVIQAHHGFHGIG